MTALRFSFAIAAVLWVGCDQPVRSNPVDAGMTPTEPQADKVTWGKDIAPLFNQKCVRCHQTGGIGPFRLDAFDSAKMTAAASLASINARRMPPFAADTTGECANFEDQEALTEAEKAAVKKWIDDGLLEGEKVNLPLPAVPTLSDAVDLTLPTYTPQIEKNPSPLAEFDDYRCFLLDPAQAKNKFITGYDVVAGTKEIVHHVLLLTVDSTAMTKASKTYAQRLADLDNESPDRLGWPCFSDLGDLEEGGARSQGSPVDWAPGQGIVEFPKDMGVEVSPTTLLVAQVHFNLADAKNLGKSDQTTVKLRLADSVNRKLRFLLPDAFLGSAFSDKPASLPPMQANTAFNWKAPLGRFIESGPSVDLVKIFPHMHQRGRNMKVTLKRPDGASQCLVQVKGYDFNWQRYYTYKQAVTLSGAPQNVLDVTCEYDTTTDTKPVLPGWGTRNEMCMPIMMVALPPTQ
jgi:mono/diheme cytochrome c family protein